MSKILVAILIPILMVGAGIVFYLFTKPTPLPPPQPLEQIETGQTATLSVTIGDTKRSFILHVPPSQRRDKKHPLLLSFHGASSTAAAMEKMTGFTALSEKEGFIIAYPEAINGSWELSEGESDLLFAKTLISSLIASYPVESTRVYATGFAEGGDLVQRLACTAGDAIAGIAIVSNNLTPSIAKNCEPQPMPVLIFNGTGDLISRFEGTIQNGEQSYSSKITAQFWADKNGCKKNPVMSQFKDTLTSGREVHVTKMSWNRCDSGKMVDFYALELAGHQWPGSSISIKDEDAFGPASTAVDASAILWAGLNRYHR